jgi:hypothetical protein
MNYLKAQVTYDRALGTVVDLMILTLGTSLLGAGLRSVRVQSLYKKC